MTAAFRIMILMTLALSVISHPTIKPSSPRKLNEIKCGPCPCGTTCYTSPPPPKPSSPPPSPKKPSPTPGYYYPTPPYGGGGGGSGGSGQAPPDYVYISGPPKDIYPVVQTISAARRRITVALPVLVLSGLVVILAF